MKNIATVILAAGLGTRMKSSMPKCLFPVSGEPMIGHVIESAKNINSQKIIAVIGEDMPDMEKYLINKNIDIVYQTERLGTANAVLQAEETLKDFNGIILVLYADTPLVSGDSLINLINKIDENNGIAVMGFHETAEHSYGRLILENNIKLKAIVENNDATEEQKKINLCNSGIMVSKSTFFWNLLHKIKPNNKKNEYYLTDIIELANNENINCTYSESINKDELIGVNNLFELAKAEEIYQNKLRKDAMLNGVRIIAPNTVFLSKNTTFGKNVIIEPNVVFIGKNHIADNTVIKSFSHIEDSSIGSNCIIGPYSRLRPNSDLQNNVHIGNFVEIKKSLLKNGSKVNHLSYIGDSEIGEKTNIGAGSITCNYDGYEKFKTIIGDNCLIGSDNTFVAPIKIGNNVITGAGSTFRKDIEDDTLAFTSAELIEKKSWPSKFKAKQKS